MKILELNGHKYSRKEFEGYKFRSMFRLTVDNDWRNDSIITIYTDNPDKESVKEVINGQKKEIVKTCEIKHWTTKEQDELTALFIEETLRDI